MRFRNIFALSLLAITFAVGVPSLHAQGIITGTVSGTVEDSTGAVIPGAAVSMTSKSQNLSYTSVANASGEFNFSALPVGLYSMTIKMAGFGDLKLENVQVETGKATGLGIEKLQTGSATETVEVSTARALLETEQAQVTSTFSPQMIQDLPTGGRLDALTLLVPGVVRTLSDTFSNSNGVGFSSNGQRGRSNNFELDGQTNNDNSVAGPQIFFRNEDALAEIQVITNNFSAQYGRNMGSVVNYVTKSGTNSIHGTAFENYTGSWGSSLMQGQKDPLFGFCAPGTSTGCIVPIVPRVTANEYGGTIGFPILKDRLFGFGSTFFRAVTNGASASTTTTLTPTPTGLAQLATAFPGNPIVASLANTGPYAVKTGNPQPIKPTSTPAGYTLDSAGYLTEQVCASAVLNLQCPAGSPSVEVAGISRTLPSTASDQEDLGRLDYQATPKDRLYLRYFYQKAPTLVAGGTVTSGAYYDVQDSAHSVGSDWTHTFSTRWINQLRYSFQQTKLVFGAGGYPTCVDATIGSCPANVAVGGFLAYGPQTNIPQGRVVKVNQIQDNITWNFGRHNVTMGGEFDYQNSPNTFLPATNGAFSFTNGINYALAGTGSLQLANGAPTLAYTEPDIALYFQDDWKVSQSLTLNLGMRWEYFKQSVNILHDLTVARQTGPNPIWLTTLPLSQTTIPELPQNYKNFEPRFGFAYNPVSLSKLVARGGFAVNFDPAFYNLFLNIYQFAPVVNTGIISCNGTTFNCLPSGGTLSAQVHAQNDQYNPTGVNPGTKVESYVGSPFKNPYSLSYTLGVQYQLSRFAVAEARYVGNHSVHNFQSHNGNPATGLAPSATTAAAVGTLSLASAFPSATSAPCSTAGSIGLNRIDCNRSLELIRDNGAFSIYNGLQTQITMSNFHGLTGTVAYTWSHTIDNNSEVFSTGGGGNTVAYPANPFDPNVAERGTSGNSYPNVTSMGLSYVPKWYSNQTTLLAHVLGGFHFNTIYTFNSGQPYTPYQSVSASSTLSAVALCEVKYLGSGYTQCGTNSNPTGITASPTYGQALYSFCDTSWNTNLVGVDTCRPIIANRAAPLGSVGINGGPGVGYINAATGASISRNSVRYIVNNQYEALALHNPYPGVARNTEIGNTVNELDMSVFKDTHITERVNLQLRLNVFNLPNRAYYGTPDASLADTNPANHGGVASFQNYLENGGIIVGTPFGKGSRNIQFGGKIIF